MSANKISPSTTIHSGICNLKGTKSRGGRRYFVTFIDDFSRYTNVYLSRTKDEALEAFKKYRVEVENQTSKKIKEFKSNRDDEYT